MGSDEVYVPCGSELSQGDIVAALPWGAIDSPLTICRPLNAKVREGKARSLDASKVDRAFKQRYKRESVHARAGLGPGIVLWHSCEIADYVRRGEERKAIVGSRRSSAWSSVCLSLIGSPSASCGAARCFRYRLSTLAASA